MRRMERLQRTPWLRHGFDGSEENSLRMRGLQKPRQEARRFLVWIPWACCGVAP